MYGMVLPRFVRQALTGEDLSVYGNGTQTRCFAHVHDVVQALLLVMDNDEALGRVFNVGTSTELPIIELARRVIERSGSKSHIQLVPYEEAYDEGFEELGRRKPDTTASASSPAGSRPARSTTRSTTSSFTSAPSWRKRGNRRLPPEARLLTGLALSVAFVYWSTPLAIRVADRFEFYDKPVGYKGHAAPTPYLGGAAVISGFLLAILLLTGDWQRTLPLAGGVVVLWAVGTIDDRRTVTPGLRVAIEAGLATACCGRWG